MKNKTILLQEAYDYCNDNNKSTEYMLEYMQDVSGASLDEVIKFFTRTNKFNEGNVMNTKMCSDCGFYFERKDMHWGSNTWNDKKYINQDQAYVCQKCWNGRGLSAMNYQLK